MSAAQKRARLIDARNNRIRQHFLAGKSVTYIMSLEGADSKTVKDIRVAMKREGAVMPKGKSDDVPHGLTKKGTERLRMNLGTRLKRLRDTDKLHGVEIATITGVTQKQQNTATANPALHDWSLSQLERLAGQEKITFLELILDAMQPAMVGFNQEENQRKSDDWNSTIERYLIGPSANGSGRSNTTRPFVPQPSMT